MAYLGLPNHILKSLTSFENYLQSLFYIYSQNQHCLHKSFGILIIASEIQIFKIILKVAFYCCYNWPTKASIQLVGRFMATLKIFV